MFITVINDCTSPNETGRQLTRIQALFGLQATFVGIDSNLSDNATITASGQLVDILDAADDSQGIIIVNSAPRGKTEKHPYYNGSPFAWFKAGNVTVFTSVQGHTLALARKFGLATELNLLDIPTVLKEAEALKLCSARQVEYITDTQFRSFDFLPRVAYWMHQGHTFSARQVNTAELQDEIPAQVWLEDAFGNLKTTVTAEELKLKPGDKLKTGLGEFTYFARLKDVPVGEIGVYTGSSGLGDKRFMEIALQQGSAAKALNATAGTLLDISNK